MMKYINEFRSEIRKLTNKLHMVFGIGRTSTPVNDSGSIRTVQIIMGMGQVKDDIPLVQQYGFASNPPVGSDIVAGYINGDRSSGAAFGTNNQTYIIKSIGDGSVAVYDMFGNHIILSEAGVKVHAAVSYAWDCAGYGERWTHTGGNNWTHDTYFTGANVTPVSHSINPPEIP